MGLKGPEDMSKVQFPKCPRSGYIAGWFVADTKRDNRNKIEEGELTGKDARKLLLYVRQWALWVVQEERRIRKEVK